MDTYTIAEAARLVGTSRSKLYQAIRTGQLQTAPGGEADQAMTVTRAALRAAGFAVPPAAAPPGAGATAPGPGGAPHGATQCPPCRGSPSGSATLRRAPRRVGPAAPARRTPADRRGGAPASGGPLAPGRADPAARGQRPAGHHEGDGAERHPHAARGRPVCRGPRLVRGHACSAAQSADRRAGTPPAGRRGPRAPCRWEHGG